MAKSILICVSRKPGMSFEDFKAYYEGTHMPLIRKIAGPYFPQKHTRRYIRRPEGTVRGTSTHPYDVSASDMNGHADFAYDAITEITCESEESFQSLFARILDPVNAAEREADEEKFLDRSSIRFVILDDVITEVKE